MSHWSTGTSGCSGSVCGGRALTMVVAPCWRLCPRCWLFHHIENRFHARHGRRGVRARLLKCRWARRWRKTDRVLRRVEACLSGTPEISGYIRRTGAELGFFATEPFTGDILVSSEARGERRPMDEIVDSLRNELNAPRRRSWPPNSCRWCRTRSTTWRASSRRSKSRSLAPTWSTLRRVAGGRPSTSAEQSHAGVRRQCPRAARQSRHRGPPGQRADRAAGHHGTRLVENQFDGRAVRQVASTVPEEDRITKSASAIRTASR